MNQPIQNSIDEAAKVIGKTWPLYTFVASNPLLRHMWVYSFPVCAYIRLETSVSLLITRPNSGGQRVQKGSAGGGIRTHATIARRPCRAAPLEGLLLP